MMTSIRDLRNLITRDLAAESIALESAAALQQKLSAQAEFLFERLTHLLAPLLLDDESGHGLAGLSLGELLTAVETAGGVDIRLPSIVIRLGRKEVVLMPRLDDQLVHFAYDAGLQAGRFVADPVHVWVIEAGEQRLIGLTDTTLCDFLIRAFSEV